MIHFLKQKFLTTLQRSLLKQRKPAKVQIFKQRLLYILPTKAGWVFGALVLVLLIGSLNFRVNLGFILTFLLFATGLIAIYLSHQNVRGVEIQIYPKDNVFCQRSAVFHIELHNPNDYKRKPNRYNLQLSYLQKDTTQILSWQALGQLSVDPTQHTPLELTIPTSKRGTIQAPLIRLESVYPFGFWRVWGYFVPDASLVVYPKPEQEAQTNTYLPNTPEEPDDFSGIRPYQAGDRSSRIVWKLFLRTGKLFSRLYESSDSKNAEDLIFDYNALPAYLGKEERLSRLCRLIIEAHQHQLNYTLRLPHHKDLTGEGAQHQRLCLTALALF